MKNLKTNKVLGFLTSLLILVITSCSDEQIILDDLDFDNKNHSKVMSMNEAYPLLLEIISNDEFNKNSKPHLKSNESTEKDEIREYDFFAEVTRGQDFGSVLEGELTLQVLNHIANYATLRGDLELGEDQDELDVSGVWIIDGYLYIMIELPDGKVINGYGVVDENGNINGEFKIFNGDVVLSRGYWSANLTSIKLPNKNIVEYVAGDGRFSTLVNALTEADLVSTLNGDGPFTVFAPTNAAFDLLESIPEGEELKQILLYHVLDKKNRTEKLLDKKNIVSLSGEELHFSLNENNEIVINGTAKIVQSNIVTTNGIVHVIDAVLIPPKVPTLIEIISNTGNLSTLNTFLNITGLAETLNGEGPFTVFAPTNAAFRKLEAIPQGEALVEVLLYHVINGKYDSNDLLDKNQVVTVQGQKITIERMGDEVILNGSVKVLISDIMASNGIVHIVDMVLMPDMPSLPSVVEIISENATLSTLNTFLNITGLTETLNGEGPFTVFAPTNAAFRKLETIPQGDALIEVLLYHVANKDYSLQDLRECHEIETLQGSIIKVKYENGNLFLNDYVLVLNAFEASNGHVIMIDNVLIP